LLHFVFFFLICSIFFIFFEIFFDPLIFFGDSFSDVFAGADVFCLVVSKAVLVDVLKFAELNGANPAV